MPSLHSSYPLIVFYFANKKGMSWIMQLFFAIVSVGIWVAAVYTSHHYVLDVLAGIFCAVVGIFIIEKILRKSNWFNNFLKQYLKKISA